MLENKVSKGILWLCLVLGGIVGTNKWLFDFSGSVWTRIALPLALMLLMPILYKYSAKLTLAAFGVFALTFYPMMETAGSIIALIALKAIQAIFGFNGFDYEGVSWLTTVALVFVWFLRNKSRISLAIKECFMSEDMRYIIDDFAVWDGVVGSQAKKITMTFINNGDLAVVRYKNKESIFPSYVLVNMSGDLESKFKKEAVVYPKSLILDKYKEVFFLKSYTNGSLLLTNAKGGEFHIYTGSLSRELQVKLASNLLKVESKEVKHQDGENELEFTSADIQKWESGQLGKSKEYAVLDSAATKSLDDALGADDGPR